MVQDPLTGDRLEGAVGERQRADVGDGQHGAIVEPLALELVRRHLEHLGRVVYAIDAKALARERERQHTGPAADVQGARVALGEEPAQPAQRRLDQVALVDRERRPEGLVVDLCGLAVELPVASRVLVVETAGAHAVVAETLGHSTLESIVAPDRAAGRGRRRACDDLRMAARDARHEHPPPQAPGASTRTCVVCGSAMLEAHMRVAGEAGSQGLIPTTDAFGTALADIVRCRGCGHMQLERFPSQADLAEAYGAAASFDYVEEQRGQRETARRLLVRIEARAARGALVDLGCWTGFFLDVARERGWRVSGVEPSAFAAGYAREQLGLDVVHGELLAAALPDQRFDAVLMADVIEHLPDPGAALERVGSLLAPGGVLCLVLPDAGSPLARALGRRWWSVLPTHVQYFTRASLRRLLERHGFELLETRTAPKAFSVAYYLNRVGGYSPALARLLVAVARRLGLAERLWAPDFRDRMLVLARAPRPPRPA